MQPVRLCFTGLSFLACIINFATTPKASASFKLYVSNEISGDVSVIDGEALNVLSTFPVGKRPRGIQVTSDGQFLLVAVSGSPRMGPGADPDRAHQPKADKPADGIVVIDRASGKALRKVAVGSDPEAFAVSVDGRSLYVSNEDTAELSAWDLASEKNLWTARVSEEPEGVALHPNRPEVFVGCEGGGDIYIMDTTTGQQLGRIPVGARPRSIGFSPDGNDAYVALEGEGSLAVLDVPGRRLRSTLKLDPAPTLPMGVAVAHDGRQIFVTTGRMGKLAVIDTATGKAVFVEVGKRPWGVALSPDGQRIFTANGPSDDVSVVDATTQREISRITVGHGPWGLAIGPKE